MADRMAPPDSGNSKPPTVDPLMRRLGTAYGLASLVFIVGALVGGIAIVRRSPWHGLSRWAVLLAGGVMLLLVTAANAVGNEWVRTVALVLWSLTLVPLGLTVMRSPVSLTDGTDVRTVEPARHT